MLIENEFTASAPVDELWSFLLNVERIAPCMPGAELTEVVDDHTWKGRLVMKFGPVGMSFSGTVNMTERDDAARRVVLSAKGTESKGKGVATAEVTSWLEPRDDGTSLVKMRADISLTGAVAQLSRGLLPEVSRKLTQQFADCLEATLRDDQAAAGPATGSTPAAAETAPTAATETPAATAETALAPAAPTREVTPAAPVAAKPVGGIGLGLAAIWAVVKRFFGRLFGGARST